MFDKLRRNCRRKTNCRWLAAVGVALFLWKETTVAARFLSVILDSGSRILDRLRKPAYAYAETLTLTLRVIFFINFLQNRGGLFISLGCATRASFEGDSLQGH